MLYSRLAALRRAGLVESRIAPLGAPRPGGAALLRPVGRAPR